MTGDEFEAYVEGRTLSFGTLGNPNYGIEKYLPNRKVIWQGADGECVEGHWFQQGKDICFLYESDPEPKCWRTFQTENGILAEFTTRPGMSALFESVEDAVLNCPGVDLLS